MNLGCTLIHTTQFWGETVFQVILKQINHFVWRYEVCPLTFFLTQKLTTTDTSDFVLLLAAPLPTLGHYREEGLTHLMLTAMSYKFLTRWYLLGALTQCSVPKPNLSANVVWAWILLIWSQHLNPQGYYEYEIMKLCIWNSTFWLRVKNFKK